jgi:hypothetical protein
VARLNRADPDGALTPIGLVGTEGSAFDRIIVSLGRPKFSPGFIDSSDSPSL